jgi:hypothetical protein
MSDDGVLEGRGESGDKFIAVESKRVIVSSRKST